MTNSLKPCEIILIISSFLLEPLECIASELHTVIIVSLNAIITGIKMFQHLLPEIHEQILHFCTPRDKLNLSCCCTQYRQLFTKFLCLNMRIPFRQLLEQNLLKDRRVELLRHAKSLRLIDDGDFDLIEERSRKRLSNNFVVVFNYSNPRVLHTSFIPIDASCLMRKFDKLVDLCLIGYSANDSSLRTCSEALVNLRSLSVSPGITGQALSRRFLSCPYIKITNTGLAYIGNMRSLRELNVGKCNGISNAGLCFLKSLINLEQLDVSNCNKICDGDLPTIASFKSLKSLSVNWSYGRITDNGLSHLASLNLEKLDVGNCYTISDDGLSHIACIRTLTHLHVNWCNGVGDAGLLHLSELDALQVLNVSHCTNITDVGLSHISRLVTLTELNISMCRRVTDVGFSYLSALVNLVSLNAGNCNYVTDEGVSHVVKLTKLKDLNLNWCYQITDRGMSHVSKLPSLRRLDVSSVNTITDVGLVHLAGMGRLRELCVKSCLGITALGIAYFDSSVILIRE